MIRRFDGGRRVIEKRLFSAFIALALAGCGGSGSEVTTSAEDSAVSSNPVVGALLSDLPEEDRKSFTGGAAMSGQSAVYMLAPFSDERIWLDSRDASAFAKAGRKRFPDIANVPFHPSEAMQDDAETTEMYRDQFYAGLYYAKLIKAANGSTLFDLMTKCGRLSDPTSGAELGFSDEEHKGSWVYLQFFPIFRQVGTGKKMDLQILFERDGEQIKARSQFFSSHVLDSASFMRDHGVECM